MADNTQTKHTPGPWACDDIKTIVASLQHDKPREQIKYMTIYQNDGSSAQGAEICRIVHDPGDGLDLIADAALHQANARLIAAAPETAAERDRLKEINGELLAALKTARGLISSLEWPQGIDRRAFDCRLVEIVAAIAKAEGR